VGAWEGMEGGGRFWGSVGTEGCDQMNVCAGSQGRPYRIVRKYGVFVFCSADRRMASLGADGTGEWIDSRLASWGED